ncbi:hypothetical protein FOQG_17180 [Fusarium oxysporum f. sp. raphani 54005]|uniref:Uncharacterized protein n=2 Tax=Fusarium oxysporum TaxID=5507 RepID=X0C5V9_FUSOX|nr:hypothetical protein FOMG_17103 [Fusarium oxysporum f. sp. melonis 26406]EXK78132.1 hypothetical protein FOQG_17180 [Fusarium oxysporum f. sp. raphani 54005]
MKALPNLGPTKDRSHKCTTDNKLDTLEVAPDVRKDGNLIMHVTSSRRCRSDWVELVLHAWPLEDRSTCGEPAIDLSDYASQLA